MVNYFFRCLLAIAIKGANDEAFESVVDQVFFQIDGRFPLWNCHGGIFFRYLSDQEVPRSSSDEAKDYNRGDYDRPDI